VDGSALPGAIDHRVLEGHFVAALAPALAQPIFVAALMPPPVADASDSWVATATPMLLWLLLAMKTKAPAVTTATNKRLFLPFTHAV
jgi:hypothetical protein